LLKSNTERVDITVYTISLFKHLNDTNLMLFLLSKIFIVNDYKANIKLIYGIHNNN